MELKKLWVEVLKEQYVSVLGLQDYVAEYMIVHYWQWENEGKTRYMVNDKVFKRLDDLRAEVEATYGFIIAEER